MHACIICWFIKHSISIPKPQAWLRMRGNTCLLELFVSEILPSAFHHIIILLIVKDIPYVPSSSLRHAELAIVMGHLSDCQAGVTGILPLEKILKARKHTDIN